MSNSEQKLSLAKDAAKVRFPPILADDRWLTFGGIKLSICPVVAKDESTGCCFNLGAILFLGNEMEWRVGTSICIAPLNADIAQLQLMTG